MEERIACAKRLLRTTNFSIAKIAKHAAFKDERSFHRAYRRETGNTPTAYRRGGKAGPSNAPRAR